MGSYPNTSANALDVFLSQDTYRDTPYVVYISLAAS